MEYVRLNDGNKIPAIGFGVFMIPNDGPTYDAVLQALKAGTDGARLTSRVEEGGVYYFQAWNAFSLNFRDMDISPYQVHYVGKAGKELASALEASGRTITVTVLP